MKRNDREQVYARWRLLKTLVKLEIVSSVNEEIVKLYKLKKMWDSSYGR